MCFSYSLIGKSLETISSIVVTPYVTFTKARSNAGPIPATYATGSHRIATMDRLCLPLTGKHSIFYESDRETGK
jgi:hypothetical protein